MWLLQHIPMKVRSVSKLKQHGYGFQSIGKEYTDIDKTVVE
jgi:hypothetical protein